MDFSRFVAFSISICLLVSGVAMGGDRSHDCAGVIVAANCTGMDCAQLRVGVHNATTSEVMLSESNLPWNSRAMFQARVFSLSRGFEQVPQGVWNDKNSPGVVTVEPDQSLSGVIDLIERYPELTGRLGQERFVIVWVSRMTDIRGTFLSACTGSMLGGIPAAVRRVD
jgi:hypothetical protein